MKENLRLIKIMFGLSVTSLALFVGFYLYGIHFCRDIYALFDCTLPFFFLTVISVIGFGAAQHKCNCEEEKKPEIKCIEKKTESKKSKKFDKRYIVKTYSREGIHTKQINMRGNYGMLKSA